MRIALIRQKYSPFGGAERYMARLVEGLAAAGHEVHIIASSWESGGDQAVTLHRAKALRRPGWLRALTFSLSCREIIRREQFDIVFSLERTLLQDIFRAGDGCHRQWLRQKNLGKGWFSRLLTYASPVQLAYLYLERQLYTDPRLRAIIANSRAGKAEIIKLYGVAPEKIHVVYNGIDPAAFPVAQREQYRQQLATAYDLTDELRILYVGSGFTRKGVPALLAAAALLKFPFKLFVVGKGRPSRYQGMLKRSGIRDQVVFTGGVRDVERFYLGCDLFVFPTLYDPFSNATLEAMACGLPVITTPFNGVAELLDHGSSGLLVEDPLDATDLAVQIGKLAEAGVRLRMGEESRRIASTLTMAENTRKTLEVIDAVRVQQ
jgi:UDP-glucose:(heptosyl)LPS alpha-1,3-glucosyltransferase